MKIFKTISLFLYLCINDYIIYNYLLVPLLIQTYGRNSVIVSAILFLVLFILILFISKKFFKAKLYSIIRNKKIKYIYSFYLICVASLLILISSRILSVFYFAISSHIFLLISFGFFIGLFAFSSIKGIGIITSSTMLILLCLPVILIVPYLNFDKDYSNILPVIISVPSIKLVLYYLFLFLDNLQTVMIVDSSYEFGKKTYVFSLIFFTILVLSENLNLIAASGDSFFKNYEFMGFLNYKIQTTSKYIGNFDFLGIYFLTIVTITKASFYLQEASSMLSQKKYVRIILAFIILLSSCLGLYYFNTIYPKFNYFIYFLIGLLIIIFVYEFYLRRKLDDKKDIETI